MPHLLSPILFNLQAVEAELASFTAWFQRQNFFGEREVVEELRSRPQMCCLLASIGAIRAPDLIKFELALRGLFRTDLVIGNDAARQFVLVEFEDASATSLFSKGTNQCRRWARRLEQGIGQAIDWAWLRADNPNEITLKNAFGGPINYSAYIVVCGRDRSLLDDLEKRRFEFRRHRIAIEGAPVQILTYDGMVKAMKEQLETMKSFALAP